MNKEKVCEIVTRLMGSEEYYKKLRSLEDDVMFFKMYMRRFKKSEFSFDVRVSCGGSYKAFDAIWKKYGYHTDEIETVFAEFMLLKFIICDIYDNTDKFTDDEIREFIEYFEKYEETMIDDYIGDFVGCSRGCETVSQRLQAFVR